MKLRYFSHSAFQITTDSGQQILVDPFLDGNPTAPVGSDDVEADVILLTHGHGDHLGDTLSIARRCGSLCICENELASYLSSKGLNAHTMHIGGEFGFDFGRVKLTQALHTSVTPDKACHGAATGMLIRVDGQVIYHMGDTGLFSDLKLIGEMEDVDLLLVPIGDNFTMGIKDAIMACEFIRPKQVVPMHYNTFPVIEADPEEFKSQVEARGIPCTVMAYGEEIKLT